MPQLQLKHGVKSTVRAGRVTCRVACNATINHLRKNKVPAQQTIPARSTHLPRLRLVEYETQECEQKNTTLHALIHLARMCADFHMHSTARPGIFTWMICTETTHVYEVVVQG